ncbi:hypothetical protein HaLaN_11608 [Haematococcus lacustris]|uniref:Uncharacterized protein n=1 Tax=Haematococcus lacustris TaxID=44745 RepID=A0A699YYK2_HAELA|nr:hypothetical protein HaLaN_11608 [Haematococcus lacustris]
MQRLSKDGQDAHSVTATSIKKLRLPHFGLLLGAGNCCQRRVLVGCTPSFRTGVARCCTITQVHKMGIGLVIRQLMPRAFARALCLLKASPKAAASNKPVATMELPSGAFIPTRALEPWHTLGL